MGNPMSAEDLEASVRLAQFMGWPEIGSASDWLEEPPPEAWYVSANGWIYFYGGANPWSPLTRPDQACTVLAEACRRGWTFECDMCATDCTVHIKHDSGMSRVTDYGDLPGSWCRAICYAALEADRLVIRG